jgi:hypothetical protein
MVKFLKFAGLCIKGAWSGSFSKANAGAGFLGGTITVLLLIYYPPLRDFAMSAAPALMWGTLLLTLLAEAASVALAFVIIFLGRLIWVPAKLYWGQRELADKLDAELRVTQKQSGADDTKWTIYELFQHIDPDFLDDNRWEKIGDELRDALSTGKLRMWGRLKETDSGTWVGPRAALTPIENTYWYKAYFTYFFFHEETSHGVHCFADRKTGRPAYTDLQVNRAEALKLWSGEPADIADSYPNVRVADSPTVIDLFTGSERPRLIALLGSKKLTSWARISADTSSDHVMLGGEIWGTHSFRFIPKQPDPGTINQTYLRSRKDSNSSHYDVCLNYAQLKRIWPGLSIRRSKCDVM